jgi:hypothetical protein
MTWQLRRRHVVVAICVVALGSAGVAEANGKRHAAIARVTVTITDRSLRVSPLNPSSGATKFVVVNKGTKNHLLAITGPGLKGVRSGKVAGGGSATLTVKLRPGTYVLSDPVGLGAYTSAFLSVVKAVSMTGRGTDNKVVPEVELPPMCGMYITP